MEGRLSVVSPKRHSLMEPICEVTPTRGTGSGGGALSSSKFLSDRKSPPEATGTSPEPRLMGFLTGSHVNPCGKVITKEERIQKLSEFHHIVTVC